MPAKSCPVIFGEVLYDRFPDGHVVLGGAPFNVAWHLQAFNQSPLLISRVGNDSLGRNILQAMQDHAMNRAGLQQDSQHPTGTVDVHFTDGEPRYEIVEQRAYDFIQTDSLPPFAASLLYHGTLALRHSVSAATLTHLKKDCHAPIFLDVNLRPPWWTMQTVQASLQGARWVKLNEEELNLLVTETAGLTAKSQTLLDHYKLELLIVTRGDQGATAYTADGRQTSVRPDKKTTVVDTVGAGDAFTSVTITGLLNNWPLHDTLQRAQSFASALVGVRGATVQDADFYRAFSERWELKQL